MTISLLTSAVLRKRMKCCAITLLWQHTDFLVTSCRIVKNFAGWDPSVTTCLALKSSCQTGTKLAISLKCMVRYDSLRQRIGCLQIIESSSSRLQAIRRVDLAALAFCDLWSASFAVYKFVVLLRKGPYFAGEKKWKRSFIMTVWRTVQTNP